MCEHCGCMSLTTVAELTREHDAALEHAREARWALASSDGPAATAACTELMRLLAPHTAVEEQALFPAMAAEYPEHVASLVDDHRAMHPVLIEIADCKGVPAPGWEMRLQHALDVLRNHIFREQDGLFPAALIALSAPDWEHAEQVRATVGSALDPAGKPLTPA